MTVTILAMKSADMGACKALASIQIGPLVIHDFRVVQQPGQRAYVQCPQTSWIDRATGKPRYKPMLEYPAEWKADIDTAIMAEYNSETYR